MEKNIVSHSFSITNNDRSIQKKQKSICIWLTGYSGSGKSTIANQLDSLLFKKNYHSYILDGDNVRFGLNSDLSFSLKDRSENIRRVSEVSKILVNAGLITIVSFISPMLKERVLARSLFNEKQFVEIYLSTPIKECEKRDPKGLYKMARRGELTEFTGIDSPYEPPESPEIKVDTSKSSINESVQIIFNYIKNLIDD